MLPACISGGSGRCQGCLMKELLDCSFLVRIGKVLDTYVRSACVDVMFFGVLGRQPSAASLSACLFPYKGLATFIGGEMNPPIARKKKKRLAGYYRNRASSCKDLMCGSYVKLHSKRISVPQSSWHAVAVLAAAGGLHPLARLLIFLLATSHIFSALET